MELGTYGINKLIDIRALVEVDKEDYDAQHFLAKILDASDAFDQAVHAWRRLREIRNDAEAGKGLQKAEIALKQSKEKNYYKTLGVPRNANTRKIKKAYRMLAMKLHPDKHSGASEQKRKEVESEFQEVAEAYEVLSDDEKRAKYDRGEPVFENQGGGGQQGRRGFPFHHFARGGGGGFPGGGFGGGGPGNTFHFQFR